MGVHDKHKINMLIDRLTLESLSLMEQHISAKVELEKCMAAGEGYISKARYIMGHQQVSRLQLPSKDSGEFLALGVVSRGQDRCGAVRADAFHLQFREVCRKDDNAAGVVNPLSWFGLLVPQSLHLAQAKFKQTLEWSAKSANVQHKLSDCLGTIVKLNKLIE